MPTAISAFAPLWRPKRPPWSISPRRSFAQVSPVPCISGGWNRKTRSTPTCWFTRIFITSKTPIGENFAALVKVQTLNISKFQSLWRQLKFDSLMEDLHDRHLRSNDRSHRGELQRAATDLRPSELRTRRFHRRHRLACGQTQHQRRHSTAEHPANVSRRQAAPSASRPERSVEEVVHRHHRLQKRLFGVRENPRTRDESCESNDQLERNQRAADDAATVKIRPNLVEFHVRIDGWFAKK